MPPPPDAIAKAAKILASVKLGSFVLSPATVLPFHSANMSWSVTGNPGFDVTLNGTAVPKAGSRVVQPLATTTFTLRAHALVLQKVLGTKTITLDTNACFT